MWQRLYKTQVDCTESGYLQENEATEKFPGEGILKERLARHLREEKEFC